MKREKIINLFISFILFAFILTGCISGDSDKSNVTENGANSNQNSTALRFVVMADSQGDNDGINLEVVTKTLAEIKKISPQPSFAVMPGDLISGTRSYSETKDQLVHFKNTITQYYPIEFFYPGFGNHEAAAGKSGEQAFEDVFTETEANFLDSYHKTVYYFDRYNTRFYMLNSSHHGEKDMISDVQLNWIKTNTDSGKLHNVYFFHQPAYPTGAHIGSSLDVNGLQRDKLWEVIDSSVNPIVFCGHEHNYSRRHIDSDFNETIKGQSFSYSKVVYQIVTGTFGGFPSWDYGDNRNVDVPPIPEYSYTVVDINESKIHVTVYNLEGKIIDDFEQ